MTRDALISYVPATGGPRLYSEVVVVPRSRGVVRKCAELVERTVARRSVYISSLLLHAVSLSLHYLSETREPARGTGTERGRARGPAGGAARRSGRPLVPSPREPGPAGGVVDRVDRARAGVKVSPIKRSAHRLPPAVAAARERIIAVIGRSAVA